MKRILIALSLVFVASTVVIFGFQHYRIAADIHPNEQLQVDGITWDYRIVVPHTLPKLAPVVFAFHGTGDSTDSMAAYSSLDRLAVQQGFILVYPAARKSMWATMETDNLDENVDICFFDLLLDQISHRFEIDRQRIYLVGMSNGASFVQLLAAARSNDIAAVVAHSGSMPCEIISSDNPRPVMLIVGSEDSAFFAMRSDADKYRAVGHYVEFVSVPGLAHEWSTRHNADMWIFFEKHSATRKQ